MEEVFKALADPSRRLLLDRLFENDGQTLGDLEGHLPGMTRFGVMKHLRVLEGASLITTRRSGREKLHYLNPVPIRMLYERWVSKFAEPLVSSLTDLKRQLEDPHDEQSKARIRNGDRRPAGKRVGGDYQEGADRPVEPRVDV
jgi:DNA-binding transcriptional ArsR family regulator